MIIRFLCLLSLFLPAFAAQPVAVLNIQPQIYAEPIPAYGQLDYDQSSVVRAPFSARLMQLPVKLGQPVAAGEVMAVLDDHMLRLELNKAEATRRSAQQRLKRLQSLHQSQAASLQEILEAQTELDIAIAELELLKTRLQQAQIQAPRAGLIIELPVRAGDSVQNQQIIARLAEPTSLILKLQLPYELFLQVDSQAQVMIRLEGLSESYAGRIEQIAPRLQKQQISLHIKADWPPAARAGQIAYAQFQRRPQKLILIPMRALRQDQQGDYVFIAEQDKAIKRYIQTDRLINNQIEVIAGLQIGDQLIHRGLLQLQAGDKIVIP